jgi:hypothetical protein
MKNENNVFEIETSSDLQLTVQATQTEIVDNNETHKGPEEISFLLYGYKPEI